MPNDAMQIVRLLVVVFRRGDDLPEADAIGSKIVALLTKLGWQCEYRVANIHDVKPVETPFEQEGFHVLIVHLTDFVRELAGCKRPLFETDDTIELLAISRSRIKSTSARVISRHAVLVCDGGQLDRSVKEVKRLEFAGNQIFDLKNVLVCWRLRFFPVSEWAQFIAAATQSFLLAQDRVTQELVKAWMENESAFLSSDLIWFSAGRPTLVVVASPFPQRPLGRCLPDLRSVCKCDRPRYRRQPKWWMIEHNCEEGMALKDVDMTAKCSWCGRRWRLIPNNFPPAFLSKVGNRFSVVMPYFRPR